MGVGRNFARGRCDEWIAAVEEGSMEEGGAKSVKVGETEEEGDESGYEQQHSTHALTVGQFTSAVQGNVYAWEDVR